MTEQQTPEQYDPAAYTVDEVNAYLETADDAERARVLQAEADRGEDARKGIVEGPHAAPEDEGGAEDQGPADHAEDRRDLVKDNANEDGVFGTLGESPEGYEVKPADESAPEGVSTDAADGFVVSNVDDVKAYVQTGAPTMADQEAPSLEGEHYQQGYVGELPGGPDRPDLTLQGVLKRQG